MEHVSGVSGKCSDPRGISTLEANIR
jgi:hypothetical protein